MCHKSSDIQNSPYYIIVTQPTDIAFDACKINWLINA